MIGTDCDAALPAGPGGELVFRVRGPRRQGQIVRLRSPKCTVGSGPQCTLRLRARGVRGVHCLILRGRAATLVRRWAPDTRLNGRAFLDHPLEPGDLLSIGPVDLEVVSLSSSPAAEAEAQSGAPPAAPPAGPAEPTEAQAAGQTPPADQGGRRAHGAARTAGEALAALSRQQAALHGQQTELRQRELACRGKEQALAAQAQQLQSDRAALAAQSEQLAAERNALAAQSEQLSAERTALAAEAKRLEDAGAQLDARREQLEADRSAWDAQQADANGQYARQSETFRRRTSELEQARDDLDRRRREWEAERTSRAQQQDQWAEQLDARQQELDQRQEHLAEQQQVAAERAARLDAREQALDQREKDLQEQERLAAQRATRFDAQQRQLDELAERLESQRRELESREPAPAELLATGRLQGDAVSELRATSDRQESPTDESVADSPAQPAAEEQPAGHRSTDDPAAGEQPLVFEEPSERAPVELSAVLRNMGTAPLVPDDEPDSSSASAPAVPISRPPDSSPRAPGGSAQDSSRTANDVPRSGPVGEDRSEPTGEPAATPDALPADETDGAAEEVAGDAAEAESRSIDLYMAGLLQRSRGRLGGSSRPPDEAGAGAGHDAAGPGQPPQREVSWRRRIKRKECDAARPRAPESEAGLSAMRQLASQAARAAIDTHARRETIRARWVKLLVALTGLGLGIVLLAMWQRGAAGPVAYYGGLVGVVIALVWGLQYAVLSGRLTVNRFGSLDLNKPDSDAAEPAPSGRGEPRPAPAPAAQDPGLSHTQPGPTATESPGRSSPVEPDRGGPTAKPSEPGGESNASQQA